MSEITSGAYIVDYILKLNNICEKLSSAKNHLVVMKREINMCMYKGDAYNDIVAYTNALEVHINQLQSLYYAGVRYMSNYVNNMLIAEQISYDAIINIGMRRIGTRNSNTNITSINTSRTSQNNSSNTTNKIEGIYAYANPIQVSLENAY